VVKKIVWLVVSCLMVLSLIVASCGGGEGEEEVKTVSEKPEYGGTINLALIEDPRWDIISFGGSWPAEQIHQRMYDGNWAKGPAGGYGEGLTDWGQSTRIPEFDTGYLASDYGWEVSPDGTEVTSWFTVRQGVKFASPDTEAGRLVGGREMTVDDCVESWNRPIKDENAQNWQLYPNVRYPTAVKTGPNTFEVTHNYEDHIDATMRENLSARVMAPEVWDAYGYESATDWRLSVGTGPFMVTDYVEGNTLTLVKNPDYWMTNPVGPGKGDQLPYIDGFKYIIMTDPSTRQAALRTGQLDQMSGMYAEDKDTMLTTTSDLEWASRGQWGVTPIFMKTDQAPYNDVNVRRALTMATDFDEINEGLYNGLGDIISWPYFRVQGYEPLFVSLDDPDCTDQIKELFTYNPEKAKQLLSDAGYPTGFKAKLSLTQDAVDYYSIVKDMWDKVGVELELDLAPDFGALIGLAFSISYEMISIGTSPNSSYPEQSLYSVRNWVNASLINEPYVDEKAKEVKSLAITDFHGSMELCRPLCIYLIEKAYCIPTPRVPTYSMWWPWLKNYSGEASVGYWGTDHWTQWIWVDQDLRTSMGY
jgi:peptide/nickel transport system substrate-binding protein